MKEPLKTILWACFVVLCTIVLDVFVGISLAQIFRDTEDTFNLVVFAGVFIILPGLWNYLVARFVYDTVKWYKSFKKGQ